MSTPKILTISHRLEVTDWKYLREVDFDRLYSKLWHPLQDFVMAQFDVESSVVDVVVNPGNHLLLLLHHGGQLTKDASKLNDGALNSVHCVGPARVVVVLVMVDGGKLRPSHLDHGVSTLGRHVVLHREH